MTAQTRRLDQIAARYEAQMLRTFDLIIDDVRDNATVAQIEALLAVGDIDGVIELLRLDPATWAPMQEQIRAAYIAGGIEGARQLGRIPDAEGAMFMARFNMRQPRAESWLAAQSSRLIVEIVEQQREAVRRALARSLARSLELGINPRTSALDLIGRINQSTGKREGGFIGLTPNQTGWVTGAREKLQTLDPAYFDLELRDRRLDSTIRGAMSSGTALPTKVIDSAVTKYQARAQRYRGQVIARTESINALRAGQNEAIMQSIEEAGLQPSEAQKTWDATMDSRTRADHAAMDGKSVGMGEAFVMPDEDRLMWPGDSSLGAGGRNTIQCRCRVNTQINFGARLARIEGFR